MSGVPSCASTECVAAHHHRVDDALRMDHDADLLGREVEQPARLDHLERLVHHRRRVDRDLAAHHPVRMRAGLVGRDVAQASPGSRSRNGPPEAVSTMWSMRSAQRARSSGRHWKIAECSLSIGSSVAPPSRTALHEQRAADDQRLLVGQQQALAGARRGQARRAARRRRRSPPSPCRPRDARPARTAPARRRSTSVAHAVRRAAAARSARAPLGVGARRRSAAASAGTARPARRRGCCARQRERPRSARDGARSRRAC